MSEFNVGNAFDTLCSRLRFSDDDQNTISTRYHAITKRINTDFWALRRMLTIVSTLARMGEIQKYIQVI